MVVSLCCAYYLVPCHNECLLRSQILLTINLNYMSNLSGSMTTFMAVHLVVNLMDKQI